MMKASPLVQMLCVRFCAYYKPGKKEELACQGYVVMERLMRSNRRIALDLYEQVPDRSVLEMLVQKMCTNCGFREHDCDFIQDRTAPPCGGVVLISQLLGSEAITLEEIA
jgi:hypothetical protein